LLVALEKLGLKETCFSRALYKKNQNKHGQQEQQKSSPTSY